MVTGTFSYGNLKFKYSPLAMRWSCSSRIRKSVQTRVPPAFTTSARQMSIPSGTFPRSISMLPLTVQVPVPRLATA